MKKVLAAIVAALFATAAYGDAGTVTNHAFAIGKGAGVTGYTSLLCASGQIAIGSATDPVCRTISGDGAISAAGVLTLTTVNANVGSFGSATQCPAFTVNGKGLTTAASQTPCTPALANITGLGTGVATALALPINNTGGFVTFGNSVTSLTPGGGLVSSTTASCFQGAITSASTLSLARCIDARSTTSEAILDSDRGKLVTFTQASPVTVTIAQAGTANAFMSGWVAFLKNDNAGLTTILPTTSLIDTSTSLTLSRGDSAALISDGTNYKSVNSRQCCTHLSQVYTTTSTYVPPPGVYFVRVKMWGGGGGSCGTSAGVAGAGGGGGGYSEQVMAVVPGSGITATVGGVGTAGSSTGPTGGGNGGQSSFSGVVANGGTGSAACTGGINGGAGGTATGTFNVSGGAGANNNTVNLGATQSGGQGGASWGTPLTQPGNAGNAPGSGAGGSVVGSANGFAGAIGRIVIYD